MSKQIHFEKLLIPITVVVTTLILSLLLWQYFHDGVPGHYVLQNKDLPEISNWWGAFIIPTLTWICLGRIKARIESQTADSTYQNGNSKILNRFILGVLMGLAVCISFTAGFDLFLDNVLYIFFVLSLIIPIFYSEFILGYVLGSTFTFGAVLPLVFILVISGIGFVIYRYIRPLILKLLPSSEK
jgi:hypothetical protein